MQPISCLWGGVGCPFWGKIMIICSNFHNHTLQNLVLYKFCKKWSADQYLACCPCCLSTWTTLTRTTRTPAFWGYPPPPHDYPYHWVILDPKSKEDKVKVTNLKNSSKFQIFQFWNRHYTRHTFFSCLIRCANMKWIQWVFLKIQSRHNFVHRRTDGRMDGRTDGQTDGRTDGRTDGQTDKVIPVYPPFNFVEVGGIITPHG